MSPKVNRNASPPNTTSNTNDTNNINSIPNAIIIIPPYVFSHKEACLFRDKKKRINNDPFLFLVLLVVLLVVLFLHNSNNNKYNTCNNKNVHFNLSFLLFYHNTVCDIRVEKEKSRSSNLI